MVKTGILFNFLAAVFVLFIVNFSSCGLFDKELKQDKHIAEFKHQMNRVGDSLNTPATRIDAYKAILEHIKVDKDIISDRKRNMLLIDVYFYLSNEYASVRNFPKAIDYNDIALTLDSTDARGYFNRGYIYCTMDNDSLAMMDYTRAIDIDNDYADAYYNRGILYEKIGKYENALADYNSVVKLKPAYITDVYNNRGNTYLSLENLEQALTDYTKALSVDSVNINAYTNRIRVYIKRKEYEKALADCDKVIHIDPDYVRVYYQRATVREMMKDYKDAISDYTKVLKLDALNKYKVKDNAEESIKKLQVLVNKEK